MALASFDFRFAILRRFVLAQRLRTGGAACRRTTANRFARADLTGYAGRKHT
jgi:hypothetical protein